MISEGQSVRSVRQARLGLLFAIGSAAGYGLNIVTAQMASAAGVNGALLVFYRALLILICLAVVLLSSRQTIRIADGERGALLVFGLSSSIIGTAYISSVAFLPVSVAAVVFYLFPILIVLAEPFVEKTSFGITKLLIVLLAFAGVALVVGPRFSDLDPRGLALSLLAAAGAVIQFFAATRMPKTSTVSKLFWGHLLVLPAVIVTLVWIDGFHGPAIFLNAPVAVGLTLGLYGLAIALQLVALARISAVAGGLTFCAEPLFAALFAALILGERLLAWQYVGGLLVLGAIALNAVIVLRTGK